MVFCRFVGAATAQEPTIGSARPGCVSFSVGPDHWLGPALLRLQGLGLLPGYVPVQRSVSVCAAYAALHGAVEGAGSGVDRTRAAELLDRLRREFPGLAATAAGGAGPEVARAAVAASAIDRSGIGAPGGGEFPPDLRGTIELEDHTSGRVEADLGGFLRRGIALRAVAVADSENAGFDVLEGVVGIGPLAVTVGRGQVGYGTAVSGGVVLDRGRFDRFQIETQRAQALPWIFRALGPVAFSSLFTRLTDERHPREPYFWGASLSLQPHWRATLSIHRAAMVNGDALPITARRIGDLLLGRVTGGGFEDQVVSVEGRFHLPTDGLVPLTVYLEWGFEDAAGAWRDVPGRVIGMNVPAVPGAPNVSLGVERSSFAARCCGNPMWYRHGSFPGGWAHDDRTLGHPLGGHGSEWLIYAGIDVDGSRSRADARGFRRNRGGENLFVPGRGGTSWGFGATARWRIGLMPEVFGALELEQGEDWRQTDFSFGGRFTLP